MSENSIGIPVELKFSITCKNCWKEKEFTFRGSHLYGLALMMGKVTTIGQLNEMADNGEKFCDCPPETHVQYEVPKWFLEWVQGKVAEHKEAERGESNESGE